MGRSERDGSCEKIFETFVIHAFGISGLKSMFGQFYTYTMNSDQFKLVAA